VLEQQAAQLAEDGRRKDEFFSVMAHELRNPLAPLVTSLHVARKVDTANPLLDKAMETAERQARHLGRLVDDLLDSALLARGQVSIRPERLDVARLVRLAAEDRRPLLDAAGLTLRLEVLETPVWVMGDPTRLSQAVGNLLDNAQRFSDRGGRVEVRLAVYTAQR
jgi:signal transduction histidine kinase